MKIKELISEDGSVGGISSGAIASAPAGNLFAVPMKRNMAMTRKRPKKEAEEFKTKKDKSKVVETGTNNE
jgi:formiminotetrahydrofolate cyclodeaminase